MANMFNEIREDLKPRRLLTILMIGIVIAAIYLPQIISLSVLIYSGSLAQYAALGIGIGIFGGIVTQLIAVFSSSRAGSWAARRTAPPRS
jgi:hypothetical protein